MSLSIPFKLTQLKQPFNTAGENRVDYLVRDGVKKRPKCCHNALLASDVPVEPVRERCACKNGRTPHVSLGETGVEDRGENLQNTVKHDRRKKGNS